MSVIFLIQKPNICILSYEKQDWVTPLLAYPPPKNYTTDTNTLSIKYG